MYGPRQFEWMRQTIERSAKIDGLEIQKWDPAVKVKSGRSYIIKLGGKYEVGVQPLNT